MLNTTFDGYSFKENGTAGSNDIYYQAFFYPNNTASSPQKWNNIRVVEATGYWNCNLGDGDFLGQEGIVVNGSKVIIVFWSGSSNRLESCSLINEWGAIEIDITGVDSYTQDTQIKDNIAPNLNWIINAPSYSYVSTNYTITNNSNDIHSWNFDGILSSGSVVMNHWYVMYGEVIFNFNVIDTTNYYWGDGSYTLNLSGASNSSHQWDTAGRYNINIEIIDACGDTVSGTKSIDVFWRPPVPEIVRCDHEGNILPDDVAVPDTEIFFKYAGTDIDNTITSIEWTINDSGTYGDTTTNILSNNIGGVEGHMDGIGTDWCNHTATTYAFTNPGQHVIGVIIHWNDGVSDKVTEYSKTVTQGRFFGPVVNFIQATSNAVTDSGITFINTSLNTIMVGKGLPNHIEYTWTWRDGEIENTENDKPFSYELVRTPLSTECNVTLCAEWSDGWDTHTTCVDKDVVFNTLVIVTPEECYYNLDIIGTSGNGTVTGYSWTVSSGIVESGPWTEIWKSPVGMYQKSKDINFTSKGWYKIDGYIHGTGATTTDSELKYISETCTGTDCMLHIWNGTGALDAGGDWIRSGVGQENSIAVYRGTNGLDLTNTTTDDLLFFTGSDTVDINAYDFLSFWINIRDWKNWNNTNKENVYIKLYNTVNDTSKEVALNSYINASFFKAWQRVMIPISSFGNEPDTSTVGWPTNVDELRFRFLGNTSLWIDDVMLSIGTIVTIPVCKPKMDSHEVGVKSMRGDLRPTAASIGSTRTYPRPINL